MDHSVPWWLLSETRIPQSDNNAFALGLNSGNSLEIHGQLRRIGHTDALVMKAHGDATLHAYWVLNREYNTSDIHEALHTIQLPSSSGLLLSSQPLHGYL